MDWVWLLVTLTWVGGLAGILSLLSMAYWRAANERIKLSAVLGQRSFRILLSLGGLIFFCAFIFTDQAPLLKASSAIAVWVYVVDTLLSLR